MAEPLILALDQGTTSTRAIVFERSGRAIADAARPLAQSYPRDGWVEHDAEAIFADSVAVMREALSRCGRPLAEVAALAITNQRETVVVWERASGRPIHPAIVWQDRRTAEACDRLKREGAEAAVVARTGLLLDPYFSATKIAWLLDHVDGARRAAERGELLAGTIDAWLVWKLTGERVHATDATNASRTLLMDLERQGWDEEMLRLFGIPRALLPEIRDNAADYGETLPELLGQPLPIRGVVGDQQGALMGQGCIAPGGIKATYGTGAFLLLNTGERAHRSTARLLSTVAARLGGRATYALEGSIFTAGATIQWVEQMGVTGGPEAVVALAQSAREESAVVLVPAFTGLGAPHWDPDARGALFGLTRDAGLAEIAAAAFDGAALQTRDLVDAMRRDAPEALRTAAELRIDGGMAKSTWFAQRLADITGLEVARADYSDATALGAAMFAGIGAGVFSGLEEAARARPAADVHAPAWSDARRRTAYSRWDTAVARLRYRPGAPN